MNNEQICINTCITSTIASSCEKYVTKAKRQIIHYSLINAPKAQAEGILVPVTGLEPVRCCHRGILSPLRLPISPHRQFLKAGKRRTTPCFSKLTFILYLFSWICQQDLKFLQLFNFFLLPIPHYRFKILWNFIQEAQKWNFTL